MWNFKCATNLFVSVWHRIVRINSLQMFSQSILLVFVIGDTQTHTKTLRPCHDRWKTSMSFRSSLHKRYTSLCNLVVDVKIICVPWCLASKFHNGAFFIKEDGRTIPVPIDFTAYQLVCNRR